MARVLLNDGAAVDPQDDGSLTVTNLTLARAGHLAAQAGLELHELRANRASLEEAFMQLTADAVQFHASNDDEER